VGGVIVLLLWFYISGLAIVVGAELNAEIEHASPHGKDPGEKVPGQKRKIGAAAARAYKERFESRHSTAPTLALPQPAAVFQASPSSSSRVLAMAVGLSLLAMRLWNRLRRGREQGA
jgi:membrane protein